MKEVLVTTSFVTQDGKLLERNEGCLTYGVRLAYLQKMSSLLRSRLVMSSVKDRDFVYFNSGEDCQLAFSKMDSMNVDYAPIFDNHEVCGYVCRKDLKNVDGKTCGQLTRKITKNNRVSIACALEKVLEQLTHEPFLFIIHGTQLQGIVTRADVNKRAFKTLFYIAISEFESLLVELIRTELPCKSHLHLLSEARAKEVLYNYWMDEAGNVEISIEQYLSFTDIINQILKSKKERLWLLLGAKSKKEAEEYLNLLVSLRNSVMHATRKLLHTEEAISMIKQLYAKIWEFIRNLAEYLDLDDNDISSVTYDRKSRDFRLVLKSGAVIRTPLNDKNGKELKDVGTDRFKKFLVSQRGKRLTNKKTLSRLTSTIVFHEIFPNKGTPIK